MFEAMICNNNDSCNSDIQAISRGSTKNFKPDSSLKYVLIWCCQNYLPELYVARLSCFGSTPVPHIELS